MVQYYRRHIKDHSRICAFDTLKQALTSEPILQFPDWNAPFKLITDACKNGIGMILAQMRDGVEHAIEFASRGL